MSGESAAKMREREEFEAVPSSIADALKDGRLNPTGVFEDQTFADIAAVCSFMGKNGVNGERQQGKHRGREGVCGFGSCPARGSRGLLGRSL